MFVVPCIHAHPTLTLIFIFCLKTPRIVKKGDRISYDRYWYYSEFKYSAVYLIISITHYVQDSLFPRLFPRFLVYISKVGKNYREIVLYSVYILYLYDYNRFIYIASSGSNKILPCLCIQAYIYTVFFS